MAIDECINPTLIAALAFEGGSGEYFGGLSVTVSGVEYFAGGEPLCGA